MVKGVSRWVMAAALAGAGWARTGPVHAAQERGEEPPSPVLVAGWIGDDLDEADDPDEDDKPEDRAEELYEEGTDALDEEQWDQAIARFDELLRLGGPRTEAALYWKAQALGKAGRKQEALATLGQLRKQAPQSNWAHDSQALEMEIRQSSGERPRPEAAADEDLQLIALNALLAADSSKAIPMLERFLSSSSSRKLRDRALFVLTQSDEPQARAIVADIARGRRQIDLQRSAIRYLGVFGSAESRKALSEIYAGSSDVSIKKAVLQAYMVSGDTQSVLAAARGESSPDLRQAAIQQLGAMGAQSELWDMYQSSSDVPTRKAILHGMFIGGGDERLIALSRSEQNPELRRAVVRNLGLLGSPRTGETLVALYKNDTDPGIRREAIQGLFIQGNCGSLVQLARAEKDPAMKKELVTKLSLINCKEGTEYLMELLK
jgi:HEAT repeat protein